LIVGEEDDVEGEEGEIEDEPSPINLDLEDGEVDEDPAPKPKRREIPAEDLEEGEVSDEPESGSHPTNKNKMPICRFFGKGQCTWGSNCRFLHPGVIDKGLYAMFDGMRPAPAAPPIQTSPNYKQSGGHVSANYPPSAPIHIEKVEILEESEWERAQRHAKEVRIIFRFALENEKQQSNRVIGNLKLQHANLFIFFADHKTECEAQRDRH